MLDAQAEGKAKDKDKFKQEMNKFKGEISKLKKTMVVLNKALKDGDWQVKKAEIEVKTANLVVVNKKLKNTQDEVNIAKKAYQDAEDSGELDEKILGKLRKTISVAKK